MAEGVSRGVYKADYSNPDVGEYAGGTNVVDLQSRRKEPTGEFGEPLDDIDSRRLAEQRGERIPLRGPAVDVRPEALKLEKARLEKVKNDKIVREIRQGITGMESQIKQINDIDVFVDYLVDLYGWIQKYPGLSPQTKQDFRLSEDADQVTLFDLMKYLKKMQSELNSGDMTLEKLTKLAVLPSFVPEAYGFQEAARNIVGKLSTKKVAHGK